MAVALAVNLHVAAAHADGGHIALRSTSGSYTITLFTAPDPLVSGPVDMSLLIQDRATGEVFADATAAAVLTCPDAQPLSFSLTRSAASNKLLLAATPILSAPGSYALVLRVERPGTAPANFTTVLSVAEDHRRRSTLLFAILLPLAAILLFLVNQHAKYQRLRRRPALH